MHLQHALVASHWSQDIIAPGLTMVSTCVQARRSSSRCVTTRPRRRGSPRWAGPSCRLRSWWTPPPLPKALAPPPGAPWQHWHALPVRDSSSCCMMGTSLAQLEAGCVVTILQCRLAACSLSHPKPHRVNSDHAVSATCVTSLDCGCVTRGLRIRSGPVYMNMYHKPVDEKAHMRLLHQTMGAGTGKKGPKPLNRNHDLFVHVSTV